MSEVWVLMSGCTGDEGIQSIHATEEKAEAERHRLNQDSYWRTVPKWIEKWEVK